MCARGRHGSTEIRCTKCPWRRDEAKEGSRGEKSKQSNMVSESQVCVCALLCAQNWSLSCLFIVNQRHHILHSFSCMSNANRQEIVFPVVCCRPSVIATRYENTICNVLNAHSLNYPTALGKKKKVYLKPCHIKGDLWGYIAFNPNIDWVALQTVDIHKYIFVIPFQMQVYFPRLSCLHSADLTKEHFIEGSGVFSAPI